MSAQSLSKTIQGAEFSLGLVDKLKQYREERRRNPNAIASEQRIALINALCHFCRLEIDCCDLEPNQVVKAAHNGSLPIGRTFEDLMLLVSDPASIEFQGNYDYWYKIKFDDLCGDIDEIVSTRILAAGLLKYMGKFDFAARIYETLTHSALERAHSFIGIGDLYLLSALHTRHLSEHEGIWPFRQVTAARSIGKALQWSRYTECGFEAAEQCFAKASAEVPNLPLAHYARAVLERALGRYQAAADSYAQTKKFVAEPVKATLHDQELRYSWGHLPLKESLVRPNGLIGFIPEEKLNYEYRLYNLEGFQHIRRGLSSPPLLAHIARDAWPLSPALTSVRIDDQILSDTLMFNGREREMWEPSLAVSDGRHARYSKGEPVQIDRPVVLLPGLGSFYFHFLFDVVGSLAVVPRASWEGRDFVFSQGPTDRTVPMSWQNEILSMIGAPSGTIHRGEVFYRDAIVCSYPSQNNLIVPGVVRFLREQLGRPSLSDSHKRIFFTRSAGRTLASGPALKLRSLVEAHGFRCLDPMHLTVRQQREVLSNCGVFLCEAGSGLANMIFLPSGAKVVTLGTNVAFKDYFCPIASVLGQEMHVVLSDVETMYPRHQFHWSAFTPTVDFEALKKCLDLVAPRTSRAAI